MIINEKFPVKKILVVGMLLVLGSLGVKGQTPVYFLGDKTGNLFNKGTLGNGTASISSPMISHPRPILSGGFYYGLSTSLNSNAAAPATLVASRGLGLLSANLNGADSYIQFRNLTNVNISANTRVYVSLIQKPTISGIGIPLGGLLGAVELSSINGRGYNGASNYDLGSFTSAENPGTPVATSATKAVLDKNGNWYATFVPTQDFNSVRLNVQFPTDLSVLDVAREISVNVYNAFTISGNICDNQPQFTNAGEATGITINAGAIIKGLELSQLVANPNYAITGNPAQYSSFSSGVASIGVANTVSQSFYYDHATTLNDGIHLKLGLSNSLIGLSLLQLNGIKFYAYSGSSETPVYTKGLGDLAALLGLDLLNLINLGSSHKEIELSFKLGVSFDRFKIEFDRGVLGIGVLGDALRIYDASLQPAAPTITVQPSTINASNVCEGLPANFLVDATAPTGSSISSYKWEYFDGSAWVATGTNSKSLNIASTNISMNNRLYRVKVTGGNATCPQDVVSIPVPLTIVAKPTITIGNNPIACKGVTNASLTYSAISGNPISYSIVWTTSGLSNVLDSSLPSSPISISIPNAVAPATYLGNLTVKNANGCISNIMPISVQIHPKPLTPHVEVQ